MNFVGTWILVLINWEMLTGDGSWFIHQLDKGSVHISCFPWLYHLQSSPKITARSLSIVFYFTSSLLSSVRWEVGEDINRLDKLKLFFFLCILTSEVVSTYPRFMQSGCLSRLCLSRDFLHITGKERSLPRLNPAWGLQENNVNCTFYSREFNHN